MAISFTEDALLAAGVQTISLSSLLSATASSSNPAYLVLDGLDRNEYTAAATGATGHLSGNGNTANFAATYGDQREVAIVFSYDAASGRYYNSTYGYLDQMTYTSSGSANDITNLSLFGTNSLSQANARFDNYGLVSSSSFTYLGSATISNQPGVAASQATPSSIATIADSFVGKAWNENGCWILASTIAAKAGASLPITSNYMFTGGQANGEWIVAFDGPAGDSGNWQSIVTAGEMISFQNVNGGGHITTCVSGTGASAKLVDNITDVGNWGQITNAANDGSAKDVLIDPAHLASGEFTGVWSDTVVIYELDTPIISTIAPNVAVGSIVLLGKLVAAFDPGHQAVTTYQIYEASGTGSLTVNGTAVSANSLTTAITVASLNSVALVAGSSIGSDTLDIRAENAVGYWGDWQSLSVGVASSAAPLAAPILKTQTAAQTYSPGAHVSLLLPTAAFIDPQNEALTYSASLANGASLPSWLTFDSQTQCFYGTAPSSAQNLSLLVTATDSSGLSASETISVAISALPPIVSWAVGNPVIAEGQAISFSTAYTFSDPQHEKLTQAATLQNGSALPSWLTFNTATDSFSGTAPQSAQSLAIALTATDSSGLSVTDDFTLTVQPPKAPTIWWAIPNLTFAAGQSISYYASYTFSDPQKEALTLSATLQNGSALPSWLSFNATTDKFSGIAPQTAQSLAIALTATDSSGLSITDDFTLTVQPAKAPTIWSAIPNLTFAEGQSISYYASYSFSDPQSEALTLSATLQNGSALPSWLSFNATTDKFSGTAPQSAQSLAIALTATDSSGLSVTDDFTLTVQPAKAPTIWWAIPNLTFAEGQAISYYTSYNFSDPQNEALTLSATLQNGSPLPSWLSFNATTDRFTGTAPQSAQSLAIALTATDSSGLSVTDDFTLTVQPAQAPTIAWAIPNLSYAAGQSISYYTSYTFSDPQNEALTLSATLQNGSALPSWLSFNATTDRFSGTAPQTAQTLAIALTATDSSGLSVIDDFTLTIQPAKAPTIWWAIPNLTFAEGQAISYYTSYNFSDPQNEALTLSATLQNGSPLPSWLTFNPTTDEFSGTAPQSAQTLAIALTATDTSGLSVTDKFTLSVQPAQAPTIWSPVPNLTFAAGHSIYYYASLTFNDPQNEALTLAATLQNGAALPSWLTFNAATEMFTGTAPQSTQSLAIALTATDTSGLSVTDDFTLTVTGGVGGITTVGHAKVSSGSEFMALHHL